MNTWKQLRKKLVKDFYDETKKIVEDTNISYLFEDSIDILLRKKQLNNVVSSFKAFEQQSQNSKFRQLYNHLNRLYGKKTAFEFVKLANQLLKEADIIDLLLKDLPEPKPEKTASEELSAIKIKVITKEGKVYERGYEQILKYIANNAKSEELKRKAKPSLDMNLNTFFWLLAVFAEDSEEEGESGEPVIKKFLEIGDWRGFEKYGPDVLSLMQTLGNAYAKDIRQWYQDFQKEKERKGEEVKAELERQAEAIKTTLYKFTGIDPKEFGDLSGKTQAKIAEILYKFLEGKVKKTPGSSYEEELEKFKDLSLEDKKIIMKELVRLKDPELVKVLEPERTSEEGEEIEKLPTKGATTNRDERASELLSKLSELYDNPDDIERSLPKAIKGADNPKLSNILSWISRNIKF